MTAPANVVRLFLCAASLAVASCASEEGIVFTVKSTADAPDANPGDGTCRSAGDGCTLRAAIMEANAQGAGQASMGGPYTIHLDVAGTYRLVLTGALENGAATGDLDLNKVNVIIKNSSLGEVAIDGNRTDRIFDVGPTAPAELTMSAVTLQNGLTETSPVNLSPATTQDIGGAIRMFKDSNLVLTGVTITGSRALVRGGGIGMPPSAGTVVGGRGTIKLTHVTITGNSAGVEGGAMFTNLVTTLNNAIITNNRVTGTTGTERGGGIANSGNLTLENVTFGGNSMTAGNGGGLANRGDAVANIFGTIILTNSTFSGNRAPVGGGFANGATATLTNVTFSGNTAFGAGGGMVNVGAGLTLVNVTMVGNSAPMGGAILSQVPARIRSTIVANSLAGGNCLGPPFLSEGDNISTDRTCLLTGPGDRIIADPGLGPLEVNDGFTRTHALLAGSPAIDAVNNNACPPPGTDQRGITRPQAARCDVGAFELRRP